MIIDTANLPSDMTTAEIMALVLVNDSPNDALTEEAIAAELSLPNARGWKLVSGLTRSGYLRRLPYRCPETHRELYALTLDGHRLLDGIEVPAATVPA